jgi:adenine-specific DNA-methyltransferase
MTDDQEIEKIDLDKVNWRGSREFFESLGEALDKLDDKDESYDFTWVGKRKSIIEAGAPINKTFRPDVDASKNWDTTENLFIEGDNLDALKLLQESYLGKVKMIYIDPPYNTGKDFVYHDNFKATTEQYDEDTEYRDEDGNVQFKKNEKSNGRYHSDWLSMMYPRLKLARNLLSEDGVIFISIDDNEQANLKKLCDEIFGEDNFITQVIWQKIHSTKNDARYFSENHEYALVYARNAEDFSIQRLERTQEMDARYKNPDNDPRGNWQSGDLVASGERSNGHFDVVSPATGKVFDVPAGKHWVYSQKNLTDMVSRGEIYFGVDGNAFPRKKRYLSDVSENGRTPSTVWLSSEVGHNQTATREVKELFHNNLYFDFPKPTTYLKQLLAVGNTKDDSIILDFFSGSATTAHAVMQLNAEDGGNRKWIMVQLPEETDEKSEAFKAGYKTIPEISRERIRRAGDKIASEHPDAKVDYGFRALRIDETNHKDVYHPAADYQQSMLDSLVENVKEDRSDLDLLYGVLTATAWELNKPLKTVEIDGVTVYKYDYFGEVSGLVACFADEISEETIKQIAQLKPFTAVFKESSFANSQAKVNLAEHFRIISSDTKVKVI